MKGRLRACTYTLVGAIAAALAACAPVQPNPGLLRLAIATRFGPDNVCGQGFSPAIAVRGAPAGTTSYRVRMSSMDVLAQRPWEATIATSGGDIPEAAASPFPAPCLNEAQELTYRFEVMAFNSNNRPLAYGQTTVIAHASSRTPASEPTPGPRRGPPNFDRAAGVQEGPFSLRDPGATPAPSQSPASRDFLNSLSGRVARPPQAPSAPERTP